MGNLTLLRIVLIADLLWALVMGIELGPYRTAPILEGTCGSAFICKHTPPIATLELATTATSFESRIDQTNLDANRKINIKLVTINTWLDLVFIPLYWLVFVLLARRGRQPFARWTMLAITGAAIFDYGEDWRLFRALRALTNNSSPVFLPGYFSHIKWTLLATACALLGVARFRNRTTLIAQLDTLHQNSVTPRWLIKFSEFVVVPSLLLGASLFLVGQWFMPLLGAGFLLVGVALLGSLILLCPIPSKEVRLQWLNYLYFVRFSLFLWLAMPALALLDALGITTPITLGILTPETGGQLFFGFFFIVTSGWLALTLARIVCAYGEERFGTKPPPELSIDQTMRWSTFLLAQVPGLCLVIRVAWNAHCEGLVSVPKIIIFFLLGAFLAFVFWLVIAILYYWTYQPSYTSDNRKEKTTAKAFLIPDGKLFRLDQMEALPNPPVAAFVRSLLSRVASFGAGYQRPNEAEKLHSGHSIALFLVFGYFALYIGLMGITAPRPLPVVERIVQVLTGVTVVIAIWNFLQGRKSANEEAASNVKVSPWYRFLSGFAVFVLLSFAAIMIWQPRSDRVFPVLASVFVLLTFATLLFAGLAFWADHYRIPVLTLAAMLVTLTNLRPFRVDHQFVAKKLDNPVSAPKPDEVLKSKEPDGTPRPLIIVTSTGGGIHAALWTAEVLEAVEMQFSHPSGNSASPSAPGFHDSILLASTVSGGSVGMMNFLREYKKTKPFDPATLDDHLITSASCSSLEAVAWGLIYPDLVRLLFPGLFHLPYFPVQYDRGMALEQAINFNLTDPSCRQKANSPSSKKAEPADDPYLTEYITQDGAYPAFTLNTTATETGDRFLLSNYRIIDKDKNGCDSRPDDIHSDRLPAESFLGTYAETCGANRNDRMLADLRLSTAARLSATFTYVSPATRIESKFAPYAYHFVDGGYYDNDGTGSVIEFLDTIKQHNGFRSGTQPILLIEIRNGNDVPNDRSPDSYSCQVGHCTTSSVPTPWGPWRQLAAPPQAMYLAGHESITRRNRRELCLLEEDLGDHVNIYHSVFHIKDDNPALSWHLTKHQIAFISSAISGKEFKKAIQDTYQWFEDAKTNPEKDRDQNRCRVHSYEDPSENNPVATSNY